MFSFDTFRPMKLTKSTWKERDIKEVSKLLYIYFINDNFIQKVNKKESKKRKIQESLGLAQKNLRNNESNKSNKNENNNNSTYILINIYNKF